MVTHIIKHIVVVGILVTRIDPIKPLWKLDITSRLCHTGVHHKTHCFKESFAIVYILIEVKIQNIITIWKDSRNSHLKGRNASEILILLEIIYLYLMTILLIINLPKNSWLLLHCCVGNQDSSHGIHKQAAEVLCPHYLVVLCGPIVSS